VEGAGRATSGAPRMPASLGCAAAGGGCLPGPCSAGNQRRPACVGASAAPARGVSARRLARETLTKGATGYRWTFASSSGRILVMEGNTAMSLFLCFLCDLSSMSVLLNK
jgi:hypothetical protein